MSAASQSGRMIAELRYANDRSAISRVGNRPIHQYWHLLESHFDVVFLPPHRRSDGAGVYWEWKVPPDARPPGPGELADLRKRLTNANRRFCDEPLGSSDDQASAAAPEDLVADLRMQLSRAVASLMAKSDTDLAAYACRVGGAVRLHSWGSSIPARPYDPASQRWEVSGVVFVSGKPSAGHVVRLENRKGLRFGEVRSEADGRFVFADVAAGAYRVRVLADRVPFPAKGLSVRVEDASVTGLELHSSSIIDEPDEETTEAEETLPDTEPEAAAAPPAEPALSAPSGSASAGRSRTRRLGWLLALLLLGGGFAALWQLASWMRSDTPASRQGRIGGVAPSSGLNQAPEPAPAVAPAAAVGVGDGGSLGGAGSSGSRAQVGGAPLPAGHVGRIALRVPRVVAPGAAPTVAAPAAAPGSPGMDASLPPGGPPGSPGQPSASAAAGPTLGSPPRPTAPTSRKLPEGVRPQVPGEAPADEAVASDEGPQAHTTASAAQATPQKAPLLPPSSPTRSRHRGPEKPSANESPASAPRASAATRVPRVNPPAHAPHRPAAAGLAGATAALPATSPAAGEEPGPDGEARVAQGAESGGVLAVQAVDDALPSSDEAPRVSPPGQSGAARHPAPTQTGATVSGGTPSPAAGVPGQAQTPDIAAATGSGSSPRRAPGNPAKRSGVRVPRENGATGEGEQSGPSGETPRSDAGADQGLAATATSASTSGSDLPADSTAGSPDGTAAGAATPASALERLDTTRTAATRVLGAPGAAGSKASGEGGNQDARSAAQTVSLLPDSPSTPRRSAAASNEQRTEAGAVSEDPRQTEDATGGTAENGSNAASAGKAGRDPAGATASPSARDGAADAASRMAEGGLRADPSASSAQPLPDHQPASSEVRAGASALSRGTAAPTAAAVAVDSAPLWTGRVYCSAWKARIARDVILPTVPMKRAETASLEDLRRDTLRQEELRMPVLFRSPQAETGLRFEIGAAADAGAPGWRWTDEAGGTPKGASVQGRHAELSWEGNPGSAPGTWILRDGRGTERVRVSRGPEGQLDLKVSGPVQAWLWLGLLRPESERGDIARSRWTRRLEWRGPEGEPAPTTWTRDDGWAGGGGHRIQVPLVLSATSPAPIELALEDRDTGWSLRCTVVVGK